MKTIKVTVFLDIVVNDDEEESEAVRDALEEALDAHDCGEELLDYTVEEDDDF